MTFGGSKTSWVPSGRGKKLVALLVGVVLVLGAAGCGSSSSPTPGTTKASAASTPTQQAGSGDDSGAALRAYVNKVRSYLTTEAKRYRDVYKKFAVEAQGSGTMVYRYTYRRQVDAATARSELTANAHILKSIARDTVLPEMEAAGIDDPAAEWVYENADGTELKSFRYTSK